MLLSLENTNLIEELGFELGEIVSDDDMGVALDLLADIKRFIRENPAISSENKDLYAYLLYSLDVLQLVRLPNLSDRDLLDLLGRRLVTALSLNSYNLVDKIDTFLLFTDFPDDQTMFMESLFERLRKNNNTLGDKNIQVDKQQLLPTIQNWLRDYDNFPSTSAARSYLDEVNYINKSSNIQLLSKEDKDRLLEVLKLYDSLRNQISLYYSLPEAKTPEEAIESFDLGRNNLILGTKEQLSATQLKPSAASAVVATKGSASRIGAIPSQVSYQQKPQQVSKTTANEVLQGVLAKQPLKPTAPNAPVNIQDVLKSQNSGSSKSPNSGIINIPGKTTSDSAKLTISEGGVDLEELRHKAQVKQADIEKKLADLKNRVKT